MKGKNKYLKSLNMHIVLKHMVNSFNDENKFFKCILSKNILLNLNKTKERKNLRIVRRFKKKIFSFETQLFINDKKKSFISFNI